ncbi:MAG: ATP-binding cassette domain-containing protein [Patescibacteria group bacterium]
MILLKGVTKTFGTTTVLRDVTVKIDPGEFVCITGKSGAGKSTLLHLLTGAEAVTKGSVEVDSVDLRKVPTPVMQLYRRRIGIVFQDYKLISHMTVAENIAFPLEVCGIPDAEIDRRVHQLLKDLDLSRHASSLPAALSGGEQARVAIGRAIVHKPMILLADEPTGNLDHEGSKNILEIFKKIHENGTTVIIATHDIALVQSIHARRIHIEDGRIASDAKHHGSHAAAHHVLEQKEPRGKKKVKVTAIGG